MLAKITPSFYIKGLIYLALVIYAGRELWLLNEMNLTVPALCFTYGFAVFGGPKVLGLVVDDDKDDKPD